jgi:hypothetical protein
MRSLAFTGVGMGIGSGTAYLLGATQENIMMSAQEIILHAKKNVFTQKSAEHLSKMRCSTSVTTLAMSSGVTKSLPRINALAQLALYKSILALGLALFWLWQPKIQWSKREPINCQKHNLIALCSKQCLMINQIFLSNNDFLYFCFKFFYHSAYASSNFL